MIENVCFIQFVIDVARLTWSDEEAFMNAALKSPNTRDHLRPSRAYTLALKPQILYAQSRCLPSLVSSRIHTQLEFHAVGPWWIFREGNLQKIPSNREDVFADDTLSHREKRGLMKFLRFVVEEQAETGQESPSAENLQAALAARFSLPTSMQIPVLALALATQTATNTDFDSAVSRIRRHIRSMNYFGPGFAAVTAKYGSNAEVAQVACRSCAVGGGVYLLGHGLKDVQKLTDPETSLIEAEMTNGTKVKGKRLVGSLHDLPKSVIENNFTPKSSGSITTAFQISIISNPLKSLFPQPPENGSMPASAIIFVDDGSIEEPPIYLQVHSEDTGECPTGQCVIYASTSYANNNSQSRLALAIQNMIESRKEADGLAEVLWTMSYFSKGGEPLCGTQPSLLVDKTGSVLCFPPRAYDISLEDELLDLVKAAWREIVGDEAEDSEFMRFEDREGAADDDE